MHEYEPLLIRSKATCAEVTASTLIFHLFSSNNFVKSQITGSSSTWSTRTSEITPRPALTFDTEFS